MSGYKRLAKVSISCGEMYFACSPSCSCQFRIKTYSLIIDIEYCNIFFFTVYVCFFDRLQRSLGLRRGSAAVRSLGFAGLNPAKRMDVFLFWVCVFNLLATDFFFQIFAHPVFKMWVIRKPNKVALWNKRHFEEKKCRLYSMFKIFSMDICWINIKWGI